MPHDRQRPRPANFGLHGLDLSPLFIELWRRTNGLTERIRQLAESAK